MLKRIRALFRRRPHFVIEPEFADRLVPAMGTIRADPIHAGKIEAGADVIVKIAPGTNVNWKDR